MASAENLKVCVFLIKIQYSTAQQQVANIIVLIIVIIIILIIMFKISYKIMFLVSVEYTVVFFLCVSDLQKKKKGQGENSTIHICDFH